MPRDAEREAQGLRRWAMAAVALTVACYLANILLGPLNQDEGWYLYAARRLMAGDIPHRDFFFTQGLVMPAVYALLGWLWSPFGVLGGRVVTAILGLTAIFLADGALVSCFRRDDERWTARVALWAFVGLSLWYTYFTAIPKAYALCALGLAGGLRLLTCLRTEGETDATCGIDPLCAAAAGVLFALLADVRLSMGVLLPVVALWLLWRRAWAGAWTWLWFGLGGGVGALLAFGPELLLWPQAFFETQAFHAARAPMGPLGVAGCVARFLRHNALLAFCGALAAWVWWARRPAPKRPPADRAGFLGLWLCVGLALAAAHLLAPVPYDDYLVPALLPLGMAGAFAFALLPFESMRQALARALLLAAAAVTVAGSPIAEGWFSLGQDRFWVNLKEEPDLMRLRRAAAIARDAALRLGTDTIWTQDTYLAVEAGLEVPRGLEMGPFSKPAPFDASAAPLAAWSGYTHALRFPDLTPAPDRESRLAGLRAAYPRVLAVIPRFGQQHTTLVIAERSRAP